MDDALTPDQELPGMWEHSDFVAGEASNTNEMHDKKKETELLERLKKSSNLQAEYEKLEWFVKRNDLIGGYCIMAINLYPSCGLPEVADFISKSIAEHVVKIHNDWLVYQHEIAAAEMAAEIIEESPY